jgi:hypothetical protein
MGKPNLVTSVSKVKGLIRAGKSVIQGHHERQFRGEQNRLGKQLDRRNQL